MLNLFIIQLLKSLDQDLDILSQQNEQAQKELDNLQVCSCNKYI